MPFRVTNIDNPYHFLYEENVRCKLYNNGKYNILISNHHEIKDHWYNNYIIEMKSVDYGNTHVFLVADFLNHINNGTIMIVEEVDKSLLKFDEGVQE